MGVHTPRTDGLSEVHRAVRLLRTAELSADYAEAWDEWSESGEAVVWGAVAGNGPAG